MAAAARALVPAFLCVGADRCFYLADPRVFYLADRRAPYHRRGHDPRALT